LKLNRESPLERDHVVGRFTDAEEKLFEVVEGAGLSKIGVARGGGAMKPINMREALAWIDELEAALVASVELQSHYAALLNRHDGGQRLTFKTMDAWLARLAELEDLFTKGPE
jgi:hypothetical protein